MSRALRVEFPGAIYHAMARGVARMPVFQDDEDRAVLLREIEMRVHDGSLIVHSFSLMLNHIHLLCETPIGGLGRWMKQILGNYARAYNRRHDRVGHLWQGRYKAILVQDGEYLLDCSRYIHLNPYKAGIEPTLGSYAWSSYLNFAQGQGVASWVHTNRILSYFGEPETYRMFVESGKNEELASPFRMAVAGIALGDAEFVSRIREFARMKPASPEVTAQRALTRSYSPSGAAEILGKVEIVFADWSACQRRRASAWALYANTWLKGCQIARAIGLTPTAARNAAREMEEHRLIEPGIARRFLILQQELQASETANIDRIARGLTPATARPHDWMRCIIE